MSDNPPVSIGEFFDLYPGYFKLTFSVSWQDSPASFSVSAQNQRLGCVAATIDDLDFGQLVAALAELKAQPEVLDSSPAKVINSFNGSLELTWRLLPAKKAIVQVALYNVGLTERIGIDANELEEFVCAVADSVNRSDRPDVSCSQGGQP